MAFQQYPQKLGIPSGVTAARPASPVIGDTYYDGTLGFLLIWEGTQWIPCSAPAAQPSITVANVGTNQPYEAPTAIVTFTEGTAGGKAAGFTAIQGSTSATSSSSPITLTLAGPGTLAFNGTSYNGFGTSPSSLTVNQTITSVPQIPTIGTTTLSSSGLPIVNWTLPNDGGEPLTSITITPFLDGTTAQTSQNAATTSSTSHTFTGLTEDASYTFKVKATNANGTSADSSPSNSVTVDTVFDVNFLVVAGGGGGAGNGDNGNQCTGGGGAGGFRTSAGTSGGNSTAESAISVAPGTTYTVTVGAGGAGGTGNVGGTNVSGNNSVFATITSTGGGGGASQNNVAATGGSGGGSGSNSSIGAAGTANQGFAGGAGADYVKRGGGGGGAGAAGGRGDSTSGGGGGTGISSSISGTAVTYGGGGGGSPTNGVGYTSPGTGGAGGGGTGSTGSGNAGSPGSANTGGGGGGGYASAGGNGGSGIVILRYTNTKTITIGAGLTGTTATDGSFKVTTITAGSGNVSWA